MTRPPARWLAAVAAVALAHATAAAQSYTYTPFTLSSVGDTTSYFSVTSLSGQPTAGSVFNTYTATVNWSAIAGDPYSTEARLGLSTTGTAETPAYHAPVAASSGAAFNGNATSLTWTGSLVNNYTAGGPLFLNARQTYGGSTATWANVTLTLSNTAPPAPPANTPVAANSTTTVSVAAAQVKWVSFAYTGGALQVDTLATNTANPHDTEIGLYNSNGALVATDDDSGGNNLSLLTFASGQLAAGTYYVAVGYYNTDFSDGFTATSTATTTGDIALTLTNTPVPEPATVGLAAAAGLGLLGAARRYSLAITRSANCRDDAPACSPYPGNWRAMS